MRMHSYGKCNPNITVGAITVFALIVLYSYWNLSTYNRDLLIRLHTAEEQSLQLARNNADLQASFDKTVGDKSKLEFSIMEEQVAEKDIRKRLAEKEHLLETVKDQLEVARKESTRLRGDLEQVKDRIDIKDREMTELKSKVVSLESQALADKVEKEKLKKSIQEASVGRGIRQKLSPSSTGGGGKDKEYTKLEESLNPAYLSDPAEQQMAPEAALPPPLPSSKDKELEIENGGGEVNVESRGVLPVPGALGGANGDAAAGAVGGENLDNAEDDLNEAEAANQKGDDDPSDGALNANEINNVNKDAQNPLGVGPAPPHGKDALAPPLPQSGQDNREAAHLQELNAL